MISEVDVGRRIRRNSRADYKRVNSRLQNIAQRYQEYKDIASILQYGDLRSIKVRVHKSIRRIIKL